jgi:hypothetical protein
MPARITVEHATQMLRGMVLHPEFLSSRGECMT